MINNNMNNEKQLELDLEKSEDDIDERGKFVVDDHVKIYDPETEEVFVNKRGEN